MRRRTRLDDEPGQVRLPGPVPRAPEPTASTAAAFDAVGRAREPGHGGAAAVGRALEDLQGTAGNRAVAQLLRPVVQASSDDEPGLEDGAAPAAEASMTGPDTGLPTIDEAPAELAAGAPPAGPSWTKVGPPTSSSYSVSGTLREVANAVAARPEAGSVTATPSSATETWTPAGGEEQVSAARVTVQQVLELPTWTDRTKATKKQQAEWDRFHTAITTHETGHVSTDTRSFAGAHAAMVGKTPTLADAALDTVTATATTDNDTYDTTTDRGRKQGTGINPNIDEVTKVP